MSGVLRVELYRALTGKTFVVAVAIGCVLALAAAVHPISLYYTVVSQYLTDEYLAYHYVYQFAYTSAWTEWLPLRATDSLPNLFFFTAPLLITFAYSWSFRSDQLSGYGQGIMVRSTRFAQYTAKALATFVAGGLTISVPLLVNFVAIACFVPLQSPDILFDIYTGVSTNMAFSALFFNHPLLYVVLRLGIDFVLAGLWASAVLALSLCMKNRVAIVALPYIALIVIKYVSESLYELFAFSGYNLTVIDHLRAFGDGKTYNEWALLGDAVVLVLVAVVLPLAARKRDAL
jgi:hypothetical protein